ncbi:MAG: MauE/DoxX family redox-associated membrane protein [Acidobacteriota bacterium]
MNATRIASWLAVPARWYLGALFVGAAWHKIVAPGSFALDVATYDILPLALVNVAAITLPWIEIVAGALLLLGFRTRAASVLVGGMMVLFLAALVVALARGLDMSCGCFASQGAEENPISWLTAARDLAWLALNLLVLVADRGRVGLDGWLERKTEDA